MGYSRSVILKSFIWKLLEKTSVQGVSFIVTIILARLITPEEYGLVALIMIFISLANVIIDGGLNTALIQKNESDNVDFSTIFFFSILISIFLYILLFFLSPIIAGFYSQPQLIPIIRILGINLIFFSFNSIQRAYVSKNMLFKKLFYSGFIAVLISGFIGIVLAYKGYGVWALVIQSILSQLFITIVMWFTVKWRPQFVFSYQRFKTLFDYGWKIFGTNLIIALFVNIRSLIIGKMFTPCTLAFFDKGKQFPSIIMDNINTSIQTILFPVFSNEQDDRIRVKSIMRRSIKTSTLFIFPLMIGLMVTAKPLILILLTEKWISIVPFIQIFSIAYLLKPIQTANVEAIKSLGYSNITFKLELIKKVVELIILVISVFLGVYAIAWGVVVYNFISLFINLYPNIKLLNYGFKEQFGDILPMFFISLLMGLIIYFIQYLHISNLLILIIQFVLGVFVYSLLCYLFKLDSFLYLLNLIKSYVK